MRRCDHAQPHCPLCDCDECYDHVDHAPVARESNLQPPAPQAQAPPALQPVQAFTAPPPPPPSSLVTSPPSFFANPANRYLVYAGLTAAVASLIIISKRHRSMHHWHRWGGRVGGGATPTPAYQSHAYEQGFRKGAEVTAVAYQNMAADAEGAVKKAVTEMYRGRWRGH